MTDQLKMINKDWADRAAKMPSVNDTLELLYEFVEKYPDWNKKTSWGKLEWDTYPDKVEFVADLQARLLYKVTATYLAKFGDDPAATQSLYKDAEFKLDPSISEYIWDC